MPKSEYCFSMRIYKIIILVFAILFVPLITFAYYGEFGFWFGVWHGITFPFRIFLKLIWTDIVIYEQFDGTYWYHVGYLIGVISVLGGSVAR